MFGIELADASLLPAMLIALLGGALSFLSPCVLPIVPPYLAYMSGITVGELSGESGTRRRPILPALFFVLGLSTVFLLMGATASALGQFFLTYQHQFAAFAGVIVMVFGLHFLHILRLPFLNYEARIDAGDRGGSAFGAYVLGLAFAFGWTPCLGPVLAAVLSLAVGEASAVKGAFLLVLYALGLGLPFILVAVFFPSLKGLMAFMKRHMDRIERIMGLLLWTIGLMMLTGGFSLFAYWLLETFPWLATVG